MAACRVWHLLLLLVVANALKVPDDANVRGPNWDPEEPRYFADNKSDVKGDLEKFTEEMATVVVNSVGYYDKLHHNITWRDALVHCEKKNKRLCMREDYCPNGIGKPPKPGIQVGEAWAPVSDMNNDWVFIGNDMKRVCSTVTELTGSHPAWGRDSAIKSFKENVFCCPMKLDALATTGPSWDDAVDFCRNKNMRLCSLEEICPQGPGKAPIGGVLEQAAWSAVYDAKNEWASVGYTFPRSLMCKTHREIAHRQPAWGKKRSSTPKRGVVKCCKDYFINLPGNINYKEAQKMCEQKQKRLCWASEYCPDGARKGPRGGARPSEAWSPVGDQENEWIGVGRGKPDQMCIKYSKWMGGVKPKWGNTEGTKGYVQCCSGPAPGSHSVPKKEKRVGNGTAVPVVRDDGRALSADTGDEKRIKRAKAEAHAMLSEAKRKQSEQRTKDAKQRSAQLKHAEETKKQQEKINKAELAKEQEKKAKAKAHEEQAKATNRAIAKARELGRKEKDEMEKGLAEKAEDYNSRMKKAIADAQSKEQEAMIRAQHIINEAQREAKKQQQKASSAQRRLPVQADLYPIGETQYHPEKDSKA